MKNIRRIMSYPEGGVVSTVVSKGEKASVTLFCMAAGTEISDHTSTKDALVYVIEGTGIFMIEGEKISLNDGVFFEMKKDSVHSISAHKNLAFLLFLF